MAFSPDASRAGAVRYGRKVNRRYERYVFPQIASVSSLIALACMPALLKLCHPDADE
jgi:hypothetical protein